MKDLELITLDELTSKFRISFKKNNSYIKGSKNLLQRIIKYLLTQKGTNYFARDFGCFLSNMIKIVNNEEIESVKGSVPILIQDIEKKLKEEDLITMFNGLRLSSDEQLKSLSLISVEFDDLFGGWLVNLNLSTNTEVVEFKV